MRRRDLLKTSAAGLASLAMPSVPRAAEGRRLTFIPQSDLAVLDPVWTTADVTRNHGYLVFDTLYGLDDAYAPQPQMLAGHSVEEDGKRWRLGLRDGLRFHDGAPVQASDVVASLRRWAARDPFGLALLQATDELAAVDDKVVQFRLKRPFPLLPDALGKPGSNMPCIMPERLAATDPFQPVTEMIGSGPYRFIAGERVSGSQVVYERFDGYVPRAGGRASFTAGPKIPRLERITWSVIPDPATAANALLSGEADWWEQPPVDLLALLAPGGKVTVRSDDPASGIGIMRFNFLFPPFDNPAIRRAILPAINQADFMTAVAGTDRRYWRDRVGVFNTVSPLASAAGTEVMAGDVPQARRALEEAGYRGERVVILAPGDFPSIYALAEIGADVLRKIGMNVDLQVLDWGTVVQRRTSKEPPSQRGWNIFFTYLQGPNEFSPAAHLGIRANGDKAWFGWPSDPKLEALRQDWFAAADLAAQQRLCRDIQEEVWRFVPYIPLGEYFQPTAYRGDLQGVREGFAQFYDVHLG
ncbi:MAG: ABC transporter substrate-binding protein [Stellaceae bacterium]